ncbi:MAG: NYN domain-containing protein [Planctomycetota bacterium]|nr:NYN domain-containing protein [Planctomycetota bacterium]
MINEPLMLIIDGYNLLYAQKDLPGTLSRPGIEAARGRLVGRLDHFFARGRRHAAKARHGRPPGAIVVFDGTRGARHAGGERTHLTSGHVEIVFAGGGVSADSMILELVARKSRGLAMTVVTSDAELARAVRKSGAEVVSSDRFLERVDGSLARRARGSDDDTPHCKLHGIPPGEAEWWEKFFAEQDRPPARE